ncbi:alpha/beta hydrolase family protein [Bordetella holmesii CDC-H635-BH]|uniref:Alpha/beta hydrolase family protein n=1 Tax=Bordetella holmesii CDC-H585-BH TaxID=1331206 RepID=A0A158LZZ0_9BORD|nr:alpha/beta hydrolase family protein [Bordetella holmesii CDC-H809-BH]KAK88164.1 alpha/beta hydrolase family protein [Bordetella holmesii CDC-H585-BH]KAL03920.1 alpha/beta hydrolase family protein [Bordetella holmesii CDC-H635-BH]KCV01322.1 alpha/beta hydrolase family protein [Bordetella holmesii CDC-H719-BH]KCV06910.1 alpha/beta hydrolase family protein [Bordetella holmesii CDC-H785-BH]
MDSVTCVSPAGFHRMAYWEWGDPANARVLLCVHGLTRNGRDFDHLARRLAPHYRVVCPDVVGRGQSDWLTNPMYYTIAQYASDMMTLLARLRPARLAWVGTSMGGLIGLGLAGALGMARQAHAAQSHAGLPLPPSHELSIERMVLNDVGPRLQRVALDRICENVGARAVFNTFDEALQATKVSCATFGPHSEEHWRELADNSYVSEGGHWVKRYDPNIALALAAQANPQAYEAGEQLLWHAYDGLGCPVLVLRGADSDLLSAQTVQEMQQRNPRTEEVVFSGVGHAPTLMSADQVQPVADFLLRG